MSNPRPRFFQQLPADLNDYIANKLNAQDLGRMARTYKEGRLFVADYRGSKHNLIEIAGTPRHVLQQYLRCYFPEGSNSLKTLQERAALEKPDPCDYALYALVSNVTKLDYNQLTAAIHALSRDARLTSVMRSLKIIHAYLVKREGEEHAVVGERAETMRELIKKAQGAYINLCGARLEGDFSGLDMSYADLRCASLFFNASGSNFYGADCSNVMFGGGVNFADVDPSKVVLTGANVNERLIAWDFGLVGGSFVIDEDPMIQRALTPDLYDQNDDRPEESVGCNLL